MNPYSLFVVFNVLAFLCWLPLFVAPYRKLTTKYIQYFIAPVFFAIVYVFCFTYTIIIVDTTPAQGGSMDQLIKMFQGPWGFLTGWVHYLCFDMVVGFYMVVGAKKLDLNKAVLAICLILTFLAGPLGFLIYRGIKITKARN